MDDQLENAPCYFLTANDNGEIKHVNRTMLNTLGYKSKTEIVGKHIENLFSPGAKIFYHTHVFPLLKLHGKAEEIYLDLKSTGNSSVPVLLNADRRTVADREALNTFVFIPIRQRSKFEDELLAAKKEAEAANQAKDEFLSIVSHELRTPLNAILGWIRVLETSSGDPELLEKGLKIIRNNAKIQTNLINDILDVARMISGKMRLEMVAQTDVSKVIEKTIDAVAPAANKKKIKIGKEMKDIPPIGADPQRLQQVLWNLVNNSVKFTPIGGKIEISSHAKNSVLEISVRDNGIGISEEFLPQVFGRFAQNDDSGSQRHGGLGLGLAISKQIVELHGGTIRAESEGDGKGAKFTVQLPF